MNRLALTGAIVCWPALALGWTNGQPADLVLGQADFTSNLPNRGGPATAATLNSPTGVFYDGARLFISDWGNNRVLIFNSFPASNGAAADVVVGQPDMSTTAPAPTTQQSLYSPRQIYSDGTRLYITDDHSRVLVHNVIPTANYASPDIVLGQVDFNTSATISPPAADTMRQPRGIWAEGARLFVGDTSNHRVLIFQPLPWTSSIPAAVVVGQPAMTSNLYNQCNCASATSSTINYPWGVFSGGGSLWVADANNHRVLKYQPVPTANGQAANLVLGQSNFTLSAPNRGGSAGPNTLRFPVGIYSDGAALFVSEFQNHRVLVFNAIPSANGVNADVALGQPSLSSAAPATGASGMNAPMHIHGWNGKLFVADAQNNRVLVFNGTPPPSPTLSPSLTGTESPSASPSHSISPTTTPSATATQTLTPSPSHSTCPTFSHSGTTSPTFTISPTPSVSPTSTETPTISPTWTSAPSATQPAAPLGGQPAPPLKLWAYPNPASEDGAQIGVKMPFVGDLQVDVYNVAGESVRVFKFEQINLERFIFRWDLRNESGSKVASGVYFINARAMKEGKTEEQEGKYLAVAR